MRREDGRGEGRGEGEEGQENEMAGETRYEGEKQDASQQIQTVTSFRAWGRSLTQCKLDGRKK